MQSLSVLRRADDAVRITAATLLPLSILGSYTQALAYRPFDGTDAAVAEPGQVEIELGPAQYLRQGSEHTLIVPALTLNYGFADRWEAVVEGRTAHGLSGESGKLRLIDNGVFLKGVLREGSLQNRPGPSIATEFGVLLPGVNDEPGAGGSLAGIVSQRWPWLTVHFNVEAAVTREQSGDLFLGTIVEGPHDWTVRPVAEVFYERDFGRSRTTSGLIGAIWKLGDDLAVDMGLRGARVDGQVLEELRAGLTFSFPTR